MSDDLPECGICGDYSAGGVDVHAFCLDALAQSASDPFSVVDRLAFLIYVRCGDRSVATARDDAAAIIRGLASAAPIPEWFASQYAALA